jgi:hypothetical protein
MNFFERFSGSAPPDFVTNTPAANAGITDPASLQLLFAAPLAASAEHLAAVLRAYHVDLAAASVELMPVSAVPRHEELLASGGPPASKLGLIGWGRQVVKLVAFEAPMPAHAIEACLQAALLPPEVKADARTHTAHVLLYYAGYDDDPLEQLVALAAVAGALGEFGAIVTLNEEARAAILSTDLLPDADGEDMLAVLRSLPIPFLYGGFVKLILSDTAGVWMRTFACPRLSLPNLALHAASHDEGQNTFRLFSGLLGYLKEMQLTLEPGEVLRFDEETLLKVREPQEAEWWLESRGPLWVLERVQSNNLA